MVQMMDALFKEITILGFIGLLVYILTQTGFADDLAMQLLPEYRGGGDDNPLAETFEMVHVVIFCVMVVFITQATALTVVMHIITEKWDAWEAVSSAGQDDDSLEKMFQDAYYIEGN